jgi:hypothetical protein
VGSTLAKAANAMPTLVQAQRRAGRPVAPPARPDAPDRFGAITHLQRTAGNRAVTALIQRDGPDAAEQARVAALVASYQRSVASGDWRQAAKDLNGFNEADIQTRLGQLDHDQLVRLDAAARHAMPDYSSRVVGYITRHDPEANRVGFLIFQFDNAVVARDFDGACTFLNAFNEADILAMAGRLTSHDLDRMTSAAKDGNVGGGRLARLLHAVAGDSAKVEAKEQVGGSVYTARGGYKYHITPDAIQVDVGMDFDPDRHVTVPVTTWFGYITTIWNHYSAVNAGDAADRKRIDFHPFQGEGHDIRVSAGTGRANAGRYYVGDTHAVDTVPHEFGHLLGLEDEYERDTADFRRVAGAGPATSPTPPATAEPIARSIHDALFLKESFWEWHRTAERRRMRAVDAACAAAGIVPNYNWGHSPLTADVAAAYQRLYSVEMSRHFMAQVDTDNDEFNDWREKVLGTFQQTSVSIMGDETDHTHPVEPRHVRAFAGYVQKLLGRGRWSPVQDH